MGIFAIYIRIVLYILLVLVLGITSYRDIEWKVR